MGGFSRLDWKSLVKEHFTGCGSRSCWGRLSQDDVAIELGQEKALCIEL